MLGENFLRYNKSQEFLFFDFETFHLNLLMENYPWEVSWLIASQEKGIIKEFDFLINWGKRAKISRDAARITGYDPVKIKKEGLKPEEVFDIFKIYFDDPKYRIVGHNILGFDVYVRKIWMEYLNIPHSWNYLNRLIDTDCIARAIKKQFKPDMNNFLAWQYKGGNYIEKGLKTNIKQLCLEYDIPVKDEHLHKSWYDIRLNYEIFKKQLWQIEIC